MNKCPICNSKFIQHFKVLSIENNKIELLKCEKCNFTFQKNFNEKNLDYDKGYYLREKKISPTFLINKANYKFNLIKSFLKNKKSILEIGCSTGEFLQICKDNNLNVSGLEISGKAVDICQKKYLPVIKNDTKFLKNINQFFDVVIAFDVIEHLTDLNDFMINVSSVLNENGLVIIEMPNFNSILRIMNPFKWIGYNKYHLTYFNPYNLNMLFTKFNFKNVYLNTSCLDIKSLNFWKRTILFEILRFFYKKFFQNQNDDVKVKLPSFNRYNFNKINFYGDEIFAVYCKKENREQNTEDRK